jgi:hypothetical protein
MKRWRQFCSLFPLLLCVERPSSLARHALKHSVRVVLFLSTVHVGQVERQRPFFSCPRSERSQLDTHLEIPLVLFLVGTEGTH